MRNAQRQDIVVGKVIAALRARREALAWSQRSLAKRAALDPKTVNLVEREERSPTLHTLLSIAAALELDLWPLLREAEDTSPRSS